MNYECYNKLSQIAQGKHSAELVLKNAHILDVHNETWVTGDLAIEGDMIIGIGTYQGKEEIDCTDRYIVPGFIDSHLHLESTLVNPRELVFEASQWGTLTYIVDPHEAANVSGLAGIHFMLNETEDAQGNVYVMAPSCVPAVPGEENGATLDSKALETLLAHPRILGLGEVMDCMSVMSGAPSMMAKLATFKGRVLDGHMIGLSKEATTAYALAGITTNHEAVTYEEALEQVKNGLYVWIREGSAAHNLEALVKGLVDHHSPTHRYGFCTDDKHIEDIAREGHISYNIKKSIQLGLDPIQAYKMASTNPAECYALHHLGALTPGREASLIILNDPNTVDIHKVFLKGKPIETTLAPKDYTVPEELLHTIHIGDFKPKQLHLAVNGPMPVINIVPGQIVTTKTLKGVPSKNGCFVPNSTYNKITCIERHKNTGHNGVGIVSGFGLTDGAIATSFAHDAHNLIVIGDNDADMLVAIERIREIGGGYVIASQGKVLDELPLEIMGLITNRPHGEVDAKVAHMKELAYSMGVNRELDPFINLSFLALSVIPFIRVTTTGIIEC